MKKGRVIIILTLMFSSCNSIDRNDWEKDNLLGKVKEVRQSHYDAEEKFGKIVKGDQSDWNNYDYIYDSKGNLIESNRYAPDGNLVFKSKYHYDSDGRLIKMVIYESDGTVKHQSNCITDKHGNLIGRVVYDNKDELEFRYEMQYDSHGNLVEMLMYGYDSTSLWARRTNSYDSNGNLTEEIAYKPNGEIGERSVFQYDSNGNQVEETKYMAGGSIWKYKFQYILDQRGNWVEKVSYVKYDEDREYELENLTMREIEYY